MELFQHPYYRLNKMLMTCIGQWPGQSARTRRVCCTVILYFYVSEIMSRIRTIHNNRDASNIIMDAMVPIFMQVFGLTFFLSFMLTSHKTLKLLNRIRMDWQVWAGEREVNILHEYTEIGKTINIAFIVTIVPIGLLILMEPIVEKIIDILLKNGTEPGKFMFLIDYYHVDEQKYYYYVILYFNIMCAAISLPELTNIIMLISYTAHGSGIFAALSYVKLIDGAYTWSFFVDIGLGMILINVLGIQILTQINNLQVKLTCGGFALAMAAVFLIMCVASQILIDHSFSIRVYIYNSQWYRLSPKTQKLLQYMTMRCNVPCQLTAGNKLILSISTVWMMLKTLVSYFAFVRSTQGL